MQTTIDNIIIVIKEDVNQMIYFFFLASIFCDITFWNLNSDIIVTRFCDVVLFCLNVTGFAGWWDCRSRY